MKTLDLCVNHLKCNEFAFIKKTGECKHCYDNRIRKESRDRKKQQKQVVPGEVKPFPYPEIVTIWHTSDKREWNTEVEALKHELDLARSQVKKLVAKPTVSLPGPIPRVMAEIVGAINEQNAR